MNDKECKIEIYCNGWIELIHKKTGISVKINCNEHKDYMTYAYNLLQDKVNLLQQHQTTQRTRRADALCGIVQRGVKP